MLFLLGLLVNSFPHFALHTLRIYGVLPRIAICYFFTATVYLLSPDWRNKVALAVVALGGYWVLMRFVSVPGYGMPTHDIPLLDPDRNLVAWLDRHLFSPPHLYEWTRDPEGMLSTLPALGTALIGLLTGLWLRTEHTFGEKARGIAIAGLSGVLLGGLWNFSFPINKKLWTSSFTLFAAGWGLLLLAVFIWAVDIRSARRESALPPRQGTSFTALLVFGTNAITAYVFSELLAAAIGNMHLRSGVNVQQWIYRAILSAVPNPAFASLLYSLAFVAVCWITVYALYRRRIFIKI